MDTPPTPNHDTPTLYEESYARQGEISTYQARQSGAFPLQAQFDRPGVLMELPNGYQHHPQDSFFNVCLLIYQRIYSSSSTAIM